MDGSETAGGGLRRPQGLEAHRRLMVTERTLSASLAGRRRSSHLGALAALLLRYPLVSASMTGRHLGLSKRGVTVLIDALVRAGWVRELPGRARSRAFALI